MHLVSGRKYSVSGQCQRLFKLIGQFEGLSYDTGQYEQYSAIGQYQRQHSDVKKILWGPGFGIVHLRFKTYIESRYSIPMGKKKSEERHSEAHEDLCLIYDKTLRNYSMQMKNKQEQLMPNT